MKRNVKLLSLLAAGVLGGFSFASANEALLNALVSNGTITQDQAQAIRAEAKKSVAVAPSNRSLERLQIRGRIQTQVGYVSAENDVGDDDYSTFEMRRVRLGLRGQLAPSVRAQLEANFIPNDFSMRSAYLEWREHREAYIKVGYDKPTFGFEENTSSAEILTVERSLITNTVAPGTSTGLYVSGNVEMFNYAASVQTNQDNRNTDGNHDYAVYLSAGANLGKLIGDDTKFAVRLDYFNNSDEGGNNGFEDGMALSLHTGLGAFDLRAEYILVNDFDGNETSGWYVMPSFYLTEKFQAVARFEMADSDRATGLRASSRYVRRVNGISSRDAEGNLRSGDTRGDSYSAIYLGGNYYIDGHAHKLMGGVEFSTLETATAGDLDAISVFGAWRMLF